MLQRFINLAWQQQTLMNAVKANRKSEVDSRAGQDVIAVLLDQLELKNSGCHPLISRGVNPFFNFNKENYNDFI